MTFINYYRRCKNDNISINLDFICGRNTNRIVYIRGNNISIIANNNGNN